MRTYSQFFALVAGVLGVCFALTLPAQAQLTPNNLVVYRVGDGSAPLTSASTSVFIDQYTANGTFVNAIILPSSGSSALTASGSAASEGQLTRSTDGLRIALPGYNADAGIPTIAQTSATDHPRAVGSIDSAGAYTFVGTLGTSAYGGAPGSDGNVRGVTNDGIFNYWTSGKSSNDAFGGTYFTFSLDPNVGVSIQNTHADTRVVNIFNGQLYSSTGAGTQGVFKIGTGLPFVGGQTVTQVITTAGTGTGTASPYAFQFNTALNVAYIADDRSFLDGGGIQKWTKSGSTWSFQYRLGTNSTEGARGLTVDWSNPTSPTIYATTTEGSGNRLIKVTDQGPASNPLTLATAAANTAFRGVDLAILPAVWTGNTSGTQEWSTGGSTPWTNWSVGLVGDTNLAFQNTNAGSDPLLITVNNSGLFFRASSITFLASGYGGGSGGTVYTLTGNNTLAFSPYAGGVRNDSTNTQTINMRVQLDASQSFDANAGNLAFGGDINLGGSVLTVTGGHDTTISGNIVNNDGGFDAALVKTGTGTLLLTGNNEYPGGTTISGGVLVANSPSGTSATGTNFVDVMSGGTLRGGAPGTGTISGAVTIQGGGTLAPGDAFATGQLKVGNNVTFQSGSAFTTRIQGLGAGVNYDQLFLTAGNVILDGTYTADFSGFTPAENDRVYVINNTGGGTLTGAFSNYTTSGSIVATFGGFNWAIYYNADVDSGALTGGNDVALVAVPVPEPAHLLLVCAAGLGIGGVIRRRFGRRVMLN